MGEEDGSVVLFDGVCNLCHASILFIIDRDPAARFRFASAQSSTGRALLRAHGRGEEMPRGVVLLEEGVLYEGSTAALRIARGLVRPWSLLGVLLVVPRPLREAVYRLIADNRYRLFGRSDACRLPSPALRSRFLDTGEGASTGVGRHTHPLLK